ncbi:MAG: DUF2244 domain-containing protein [Burkholderiaceae bacterium]
MQMPDTPIRDGVAGQTVPGTNASCKWVLRRNLAMSPTQLLAIYLSLSFVSLGIALVWSALGQWIILPYAILECLALGVAFVLYCRHAQDRECVSVERSVVRIESIVGGASQIEELPRFGIRVHWESNERNGLVSFRSGGKQALVGRFVDRDHRRRFVSEFRQAVGYVPL